MRVNISFSVELEEIPEKVLEFLEETEDLLKANILPSITEGQNKINEENIKHAQDAIDRALRATQKVSVRLDECANILSGYQEILHRPPDKANQMSPNNFQTQGPIFPDGFDPNEDPNVGYMEQLEKMNTQLEDVHSELRKLEQDGEDLSDG